MGNGALYRFGEFVLDTAERQLRHGGRPIRLNPRYFDALALLVSEQGRLVDKERFFAEVWRGLSVGDEALTQCMKTLRQSLGDNASNPRYIETVPKHGYRFVAPVDQAQRPAEVVAPAPTTSKPDLLWRRVLGTAVAGTLGGAAAGLIGGLFYGAVIAFGPAAPEVGVASVLALLLALNIVVGAAGGLGVSSGLAAAAALAGQARPWSVAGAALGGLVVGGLSSVLGLDVFALLLGQAPDRITGAAEGAVLGTAIGLGLVLSRNAVHWRRVLTSGLASAAAGVGIVLAGGTLMAGSLDSLASSIASAGLPLDRIAPFLAGVRFDGWFEVLLAGMEGLLFGTGVAAAIELVARREEG